MKDFQNKKPLAILISLIVIISVLHYSTDPKIDYFHEIYKLLYYIPVVLAAFYFGVRGGLIASVSISIIYLPHVLFQWRGTDFQLVHRLLEIVLYNTIAYIVGRLAEGERKQKKQYEQVALKLQESYKKLKQQSETLSEVEEQLRHSERLSVMGELAASLAHEVRNPLGSIKGAAEILQDDYPKENQNYRFLQILIKEVDRLNQVIETFLSLARQRPAETGKVSLQEAVESVVQIISAKASKEGVEVECRLPSTTVYIKADGNKFRQVLLNLFLNALAACPEGGRVAVDSTIKNHEAQPRRLILEISDTGQGIPPEAVEKVFKPFYTTKEHGTGLGLPITKRIAEEYNWDLKLQSEVGQGTTVKLCVPFIEDDA